VQVLEFTAQIKTQKSIQYGARQCAAQLELYLHQELAGLGKKLYAAVGELVT